MNRRGFLAMLGIAPAIAIAPSLTKREPAKDGAVAITQMYCATCGWMMYQPWSMHVVKCENYRCKQYGIEYKAWECHMERV